MEITFICFIDKLGIYKHSNRELYLFADEYFKIRLTILANF